MHEREINKAIGYGIMLIIGYHILGIIIPLLTWGVIGLIVWRIFHEFQKHKR